MGTWEKSDMGTLPGSGPCPLGMGTLLGSVLGLAFQEGCCGGRGETGGTESRARGCEKWGSQTGSGGRQSTGCGGKGRHTVKAGQAHAGPSVGGVTKKQDGLGVRSPETPQGAPGQWETAARAAQGPASDPLHSRKSKLTVPRNQVLRDKEQG